MSVPDEIATALQQVTAAATEKKLSPGAVENLTQWLTQPSYAEYVPQILTHITGGKWKELDDAFWTVIPFGTGGRRGKMYPIGSNAINSRTMGESAQGLADYVKATVPAGTELKCAIAYDTRHRSREFAELCASIMVANGFQVFFHDGHRSTPQLSFAVRYKQCTCGIMITASHNPPSDNALKVYWSTGGQLLPPHDSGVIDRVLQVKTIERASFAEALAAGKIVMCEKEVDQAFGAAVLSQSLPGPRDVKVLYSPLHGVGATCVLPALAGAGFKNVETYGPHATPDPDFTNVPGHVSNPENKAVFDLPIKYAQEQGHELIMATDPDADRLGCVAPRTKDTAGPWEFFTGNQIGVLLCEYLLEGRKRAGSLSNKHYVVKTLVTTDMIRRIADAYGVTTVGDLLVGFKYIAGVMDDRGPNEFVFGTEESHGFLVGSYARDKDAAVASLLLAELAGRLKAEGKTLFEKLEALYWQYGYHAEFTLNVTMPGSQGMTLMKELMARFRSEPPKSLGGLAVSRVRDFQNLVQIKAGGQPEPLVGPQGDLVMLDLADEGNYVAVRPSGTEPKIKFYMFTYIPAEQLHSLEAARTDLADRLKAFEKDLRAFAGV